MREKITKLFSVLVTVLLVLLTVAPASNAANPGPDPRFMWEVTVKNSKNSKPVNSAIIQWTTYSDQTGGGTLPKIGEGLYATSLANNQYLEQSWRNFTLRSSDECYTGSQPIDIPRPRNGPGQTVSDTFSLTPAKHVVKGKITDQNGNAVYDAKVTLGGSTERTDSNGNYRFDTFTNGLVGEISVSKDGYYSSIGAVISATQCGETTSDVQISEKTYILSGKVTNSSTEAAINGADVTYNGTTIKTNSSGDYSFVGLKTGVSGEVTVSATNYYPQTVNITIGDQNVDRSFALAPILYSISGKIHDEKGNNLPNATVKFADKTTKSDANGNYSFKNIMQGTSGTLTASSTGYTSNSTTLTIDQNKYSNIQLSRIYYNLTTTVRNASGGAAIPNATVIFNNTEARTNTSGVSTHKVPYGSSGTATVRAVGYADYTTNVSTMTANRSITANLTKLNYTVSGYARNSAGVGVPNATVKFGEYSAITGSDGRYSIVVPARYIGNFSATAEGYKVYNDSAIREVTSNTTYDFTMGLQTITMTGTVTTPDTNQPIPGADVVCYAPDGNTAGSTLSGPDGKWSITLPGLSSGAYNCVVEGYPKGYTPDGTKDTVAPEIRFDGDLIVYRNDPSINEFSDVVISDNIDASPESSVTGFDISTVGTKNIIYTAKDDANNTTVKERRLIVIDPSISISTEVNNTLVKKGDYINIEYTVTNLERLPLSDVNVTNSQNSDVSCPSNYLQPKQSMKCTSYGVAN